MAVWFCGRAEQIRGQKAPVSVVLDEIIALPFVYSGVWALAVWISVSLEFMPWRKVHFAGTEIPEITGVPSTWPVLLAGFLLFRRFDIWKPWPVRSLQELPGGWGVVVDDLATALLANLSLILGTFAVLRLRAHF
ncbi:MAG TPA: phosphatidylglycerophosphatase A [Candidatus Limnocylindria bacterium]|nr:phosphatidylglycerophosphatase A [Candidatus Limnocylindria bacterium]